MSEFGQRINEIEKNLQYVYCKVKNIGSNTVQSVSSASIFLSVDNTDPKNPKLKTNIEDVTGDSLYTKNVIAKPDGTLGFVDLQVSKRQKVNLYPDPNFIKDNVSLIDSNIADFVGIMPMSTSYPGFKFAFDCNIGDEYIIRVDGANYPAEQIKITTNTKSITYLTNDGFNTSIPAGGNVSLNIKRGVQFKIIGVREEFELMPGMPPMIKEFIYMIEI